MPLVVAVPQLAGDGEPVPGVALLGGGVAGRRRAVEQVDVVLAVVDATRRTVMGRMTSRYWPRDGPDEVRYTVELGVLHLGLRFRVADWIVSVQLQRCMVLLGAEIFVQKSGVSSRVDWAMLVPGARM